MKEITKKGVENLIKEKDDLCILIYMPTRAAASSEVKKMPIQLKNLLNSVKKELQEKQKMSTRGIDELLKPAINLIGDRVFWQNQKEGLAVFINLKQFYYFRLNSELPEKATVSQHFNIIPLIPEVMFNDIYYVLALSRNQNRIFRCTKESVEKTDIEGIPESLKEISKYDEYEKTLRSHSHGSEGRKVIFHGSGDISAEKREELLHYFRQIDRGLTKYLNQISQKHKFPLIVMCVKDLFPLYREVNSYAYLLEKNIEGNPDESTPDSINRSTYNIVSDYFRDQLEGITRIYHNLKGTGKTSIQLEDIVSTSYFSRVEHLLIKKNVSQWGDFNAEENKVHLAEEGNGQYDLYNFAAANTISNGGQVYVLEKDQMPDGEDIIAMYRF